MKSKSIEEEFFEYLDDLLARDFIEHSDLHAASQDPVFAQRWWLDFAENNDHGYWAQEQIKSFLSACR